ncbi:DUF3696 domain-containing protein [Actinomadura kijaniata]|uniref:DUF3696 domain-containing protein n=1 Tax=Actinomadura kijaniata TaxID=46161 RepID=UPI003F1A6FA5
MALVRMAFENYRCFKDRQEIELRPITVILGKNNSGKSAITRFPLILQAGINTSSDLPLDLDQLGDDPPEFLDLIHGKNIHRSLRIEFSLGGDFHADVKATIQNIDERKIQVVSELYMSTDDALTHLKWAPGQGDSTYELLNTQGPATEEMIFRGIIPFEVTRYPSHFGESEFIETTAEPEVETMTRPPDAAMTVLSGFGRVRYLGPYRQRPPRYVRLPSRLPREVGSMGENAAAMLASDHARGDRELIAKVNELLGHSLAGWQFEIETQGATYAVNLRSLEDPALSVNILDSGTGVAQVLPLLVQQAQDMTEASEDDVLQVIEEPELHLHPAFHPLLADLFIIAARQGSRFLVETHSETLLLRLRRRIAEWKIHPDDVAIYFVDHHDGASHARRIQVDELGNLDYWPSGIFSEDFEETKALAEAQFAREHHEG